jgi:hypothetical protein
MRNNVTPLSCSHPLACDHQSHSGFLLSLKFPMSESTLMMRGRGHGQILAVPLRYSRNMGGALVHLATLRALHATGDTLTANQMAFRQQFLNPRCINTMTRFS